MSGDNADFEKNIEFLKSTITNIEDYPKKGILFRDISTLCDNGQALALSVKLIADHYRGQKIDKIVSAEARGFLFGAPVAAELGVGLVMVRKPGKLPRETIEEKYDLEYGSNILQVHKDSIKEGEKILIIDDLLATGGTVGAMIKLVQRLKGEVMGAAFVIDLFDLGGAKMLKDSFSVDSFSLLKFPGH